MCVQSFNVEDSTPVRNLKITRFFFSPTGTALRTGLLLIFVHQTSPNHTKMSSSNYSSDEISSRDSDSSYSDASLSHFSDSSQEIEPDKCSKYY